MTFYKCFVELEQGRLYRNPFGCDCFMYFEPGVAYTEEDEDYEGFYGTNTREELEPWLEMIREEIIEETDEALTLSIWLCESPEVAREGEEDGKAEIVVRSFTMLEETERIPPFEVDY